MQQYTNNILSPYFSTLARCIDYIVPEINEKSYDMSDRYNIAGYCVQFNAYAIMKYYIIYFLGMFIFRNYTKRHILVTNIISSYVCWNCVLGRNTNNLLAYYYYDLPLLFVKKDLALIIHHIATIFRLNYCITDYSGIISYKYLFLFKTSDLLLHHYKIIDALELKNKFPYSTVLYQFAINLYTLAAWLILRIILPFGIYPAETLNNTILYICFHIGNIWWTCKLYKTIIKLWGKLQHYNVQHKIK